MALGDDLCGDGHGFAVQKLSCAGASVGGVPGGDIQPVQHSHIRFARRQPESEHQDDDTDAAQQAERDAAFAGAVEQAGEDQYDLQEEFHG